jgi:hypothetical protein
MDQGNSQLRPVAGKQKVFRPLEGIGKTVIRRFAKTIGDHNPLGMKSMLKKVVTVGLLLLLP